MLMADHPDLPGFTSMLSLDVEKETGQPFNKGRLHSEFSLRRAVADLQSCTASARSEFSHSSHL